MSASGGPLQGLRVIEMGQLIAGPFAAKTLADFGADVIKIERPDTGDSLRNMAWRDPRDGTGLWWKLVNRNKRTVALDLKDPADRDLFLRLVDDADVVIENFRPGTLERLGLGPDDLLQLGKREDALVTLQLVDLGKQRLWRQVVDDHRQCRARPGTSAARRSRCRAPRSCKRRASAGWSSRRSCDRRG